MLFKISVKLLQGDGEFDRYDSGFAEAMVKLLKTMVKLLKMLKGPDSQPCSNSNGIVGLMFIMSKIIFVFD